MGLPLSRPFMAAPSLLAAWVLLTPRPADACGGFFCDAGTGMPVDQVDEDILFVLDGDHVETHVRIVYDGEPEQFAWLLPVASFPEIEIGSEPFFDALASSTQTQLQLTATFTPDCAPPSPPPNGGDDGGILLDSMDGTGGDGPEVLDHAVVGSFETVVLEGTDAPGLMAWLADNGYQQDEAAEPILQEYLDEGFLFVAVKLTADAEADAIHPLVIRHEGDEPCVPLRLTSIAAVEDMGVRVFGLGNGRTFSTNYVDVLPNYAKLTNWSPALYEDLVTMAVDEADGQAFVTQYAGSDHGTSTFGVYETVWNEAVFLEIDPVDVPEELSVQGLTNHPLTPALLRQYLPAPPRLEETVFWNDLPQYADLIDQEAWDGPAFAADLRERIIEPGMHAVDLLETWPTLTRLYTTISPHEMTADPMFRMRSDLEDVSAVVSANMHVYCGGDRQVSLPQERQFCIPEEESWPTFTDLPWAERVQRFPMEGPPLVMADNAAIIDAGITEHDEARACLDEEPPDDEGDGGDDGGADDGLTTADAGDDSNGLDGTKSGCACGVPSRGFPGPVGLLLGGLVAFARRPRREDRLLRS